eukprot:CAMPEP_0179995654 /NCGR_PEP_ID=MMETSP0984-20121128/7196_1 /TAXON_ID=483367 /ORGANISM="non described non described, Strain CCMP 2436" /LENGTH=57 /DNA_ID=CAMNT_0021915151 /DNA_START=221 /DNA_END=394 /DNA_ORIENTATION=+
MTGGPSDLTEDPSDLSYFDRWYDRRFLEEDFHAAGNGVAEGAMSNSLSSRRAGSGTT